MLRVEDLNIVGSNTREMISLGPGYRHWSLMEFRGPVFSADRVGGQAGRLYLVLPAHLLRFLYERFSQANPDGTLFGDADELMGPATAPEYDEQERERLYEAGELWWDIFDWRIPPHGRDPIRRYLPELFEPAVIEEIVGDPRLDMSSNSPDARPWERYWDDTSKHYRWSEWWNRR